MDDVAQPLWVQARGREARFVTSFGHAVDSTGLFALRDDHAPRVHNLAGTEHAVPADTGHHDPKHTLAIHPRTGSKELIDRWLIQQVRRLVADLQTGPSPRGLYDSKMPPASPEVGRAREDGHAVFGLGDGQRGGPIHREG